MKKLLVGWCKGRKIKGEGRRDERVKGGGENRKEEGKRKRGKEEGVYFDTCNVKCCWSLLAIFVVIFLSPLHCIQASVYRRV